MPKRIPLDTDLFRVTLPTPAPIRRDPLETLIPTSPPASVEPAPTVAIATPMVKEAQDVGNLTEENAIIIEAKNDATVLAPKDGTTGKSRREIIRRAFDVYPDHVISLQRIQLMAVTSGRKKPQIGVMVRSALDKFIASEFKKYGIN